MIAWALVAQTNGATVAVQPDVGFLPTRVGNAATIFLRRAGK
jgi:hypothetical protein